MAEIIQSLKSRLMRFPIYNAGANLAAGSLVMPGTTAETNLGVAVKVAANTNADVLGVLVELHDYSKSGDALVSGTKNWFAPTGEAEINYPARLVEICDGATLARVDVDLSGGTYAAVASYNGSTGTVTITNLEDNIDTGFLYVVDGAGIGQTGFIKSSAAGSCVVASPFATALNNTSKVVKILPLFHQLMYWVPGTATAGTKAGTTAAAGTGRVVILERHIVRNGLDEMLDPKSHGALTGLNNLSHFNIYYILHLVDTAFHPID